MHTINITVIIMLLISRYTLSYTRYAMTAARKVSAARESIGIAEERQQ